MNHRVVENFGLDVRFRPAEIFAPDSVDDLLRKLSADGATKIRVIGSKHAWNSGIETDELLIDPRNLNSIQLDTEHGDPSVIVGGGCVIRDLVTELTRHGFALPTSGLILEQTVAGATATGTHGSGKPSLSHFLSAVRIVHFENDAPTATWIESGDDLKAARCSLGCLGIVVEVKIQLVPTYHITEETVVCGSLTDALEFEDEYPLQQIFVLPLGWRVYAQRRKVCPAGEVSMLSWLYQKYWNWGLCFGFIAFLKLLLAAPCSSTMLRFFYRHLAPRLLIANWEVSDRSDKLMVIQHETFRHLEIELFVRSEDLIQAFALLVEILKLADNSKHQLANESVTLLERHNLLAACDDVKGSFSHHCPICIRKVLADDTLISMSAGQRDWYSISLITYQEPRESFFKTAAFVANVLFACFGARAHWGKWFPFGGKIVKEQFEQLGRFRKVSQRFDSGGVFRNHFVEKLYWNFGEENSCDSSSTANECTQGKISSVESFNP